MFSVVIRANGFHQLIAHEGANLNPEQTLLTLRRAQGTLNQRLRVLEDSLHSPWRLSVPVYLQIENTNRCNLSCGFCSRAHWDARLNAPGDMTREVFDRIRPLLRFAPIIAIQGVGEPLMSDSLWWMAAAVKSYGCHLIINTNGVLIDRVAAGRLVEVGVDKIFVSVDAVEDDTFVRLRGIPVQPLLRNVQTLIEEREARRSSTPHVVLVFIGMKSTIDQLPPLLERAAEIGVDTVEVRHLKIYGETFRGESLLDDRDRAAAHFQRALEIAQRRGIELLLPRLVDDERVTCNQPFDMLFFRHDGEVFGCCSAAFKGSPFNRPIGRLQTSSVTNLWNCSGIRMLRRGLYRQSRLAVQCRLCAFRLTTSSSHERVLNARRQEDPSDNAVSPAVPSSSGRE